MRRALEAWTRAIERGAETREAALAAARADEGSPWDVVRNAGLLARCQPDVAPRDLGLTAALRIVRASYPGAIAVIPAGRPYPVPRNAERTGRGAWDTPAPMARALVRAARDACAGPLRTGLDPACGAGAFLVALAEAGVPEIRGTDLDEVALAVASIAAPRARLDVADALAGGPEVDLVVGNPPFVAPEHQDKALRTALRRRFPWLAGRFDLSIPFAAAASERCRPGGGVGLVLPHPALVQPYGAPLRRRWVEVHRVVHLSGPHAFPGAGVEVALVALRAADGPAPVAPNAIPPEALLARPNVPLDPDLCPADFAIAVRARERSVPLGQLCVVDTGVVSHLPGGSREALLSDTPGEGRVPYADAREFFAGRRRWLLYDPARMHRAKRPDLFEGEKIVVQRIRGRDRVRAAVDRTGTYVGHTCTVIRPRTGCPVPVERLLDLVLSPLVHGLTRIEQGRRLDLYPHDVAAFPVPRAWIDGGASPIAEALGLSPAEVARLEDLAVRRGATDADLPGY